VISSYEVFDKTNTNLRVPFNNIVMFIIYYIIKFKCTKLNLYHLYILFIINFSLVYIEFFFFFLFFYIIKIKKNINK